MAEERTVALVTGASSGLGAEFCRQLASRCDVIVAVARRSERLQALADELAGRVRLEPVVADLTTIEGVARTLEALRQKGPVDYLVNNAGFATFGDFTANDIGSQRQMLSLHCDAAITLCRAAIPFMQERGSGFIINVSSVGAFLPRGGLTVYGATKAFLNYFSLALQAELDGAGIWVQALCPGYIRTEFHDEIEAAGFDRGRIPAEMWSEAPEVVGQSLSALAGDSVLVIPGEGNLALARLGLQQQLESV